MHSSLLVSVADLSCRSLKISAVSLQLQILMLSSLCLPVTTEVALQWGDTGTAGAEKHSLEEKQRAERKVRLRRQAVASALVHQHSVQDALMFTSSKTDR